MAERLQNRTREECAAKTMQAFRDYAESIGCKLHGPGLLYDSIDVTPSQQILLNAWWKEKVNGKAQR